MRPGPNTRFEFGQRYECIKLPEYHKRQKIVQTDRLIAFCFMFILDKYVVEHFLNTNFRIRIIPFLIKIFVFNRCKQAKEVEFGHQTFSVQKQ